MSDETALDRIANSLDWLMARMIADEEEADRSNRDGEWRTEWFVKSAEKGRVLYKSEEAAYEGGRYWLSHSTQPDMVEVYCQEAKVYPNETVPREDWQA